MSTLFSIPKRNSSVDFLKSIFCFESHFNYKQMWITRKLGLRLWLPFLKATLIYLSFSSPAHHSKHLPYLSLSYALSDRYPHGFPLKAVGYLQYKVVDSPWVHFQNRLVRWNTKDLHCFELGVVKGIRLFVWELSTANNNHLLFRVLADDFGSFCTHLVFHGTPRFSMRSQKSQVHLHVKII